jgi:DNA-binding IclR family transcriptional regulator
MNLFREEGTMEIASVEKALMVLKSFTDSEAPIGTVKLSEKLGLHKATVSRILQTLKKHRFVILDPQSHKYYLGPEILVLAQTVTKALKGQVTSIALPFVERLRDQVGETVHLELISGQNIFLAHAALGIRGVTVAIDIGDPVKPNVHAGAKAIAAFSSAEKIDRWLSGKLTRYNENSITDPDTLREVYKKIRQSGFSIDDGEYDANVYAIGAPVFDFNGQPVAAVVIVAPYFRKEHLLTDGYINMLKETADGISARLLNPGLLADDEPRS